MSLTPIPVPEVAETAWRQTVADESALRKVSIGPPPGVSDDDCGTVEALVAVYDGHPLFCDYWRPPADQLALLARGGFIELRQYVPQMPMHSLQVWAADEPVLLADPAMVVAQVEVLRAQLTAAADGLAMSERQLGSISALAYVVEQLNGILDPLGPPTPPSPAQEG